MRYIILILLCALSVDAQVLRVGRRAATGASYLLSEDFDGSSACGDGSATNCQLAWSLINTPTISFASSASPAPLSGTYSAAIGASSFDNGYITKTFTSQDTVYFYAIVNHVLRSVHNHVISIRNGTTVLMTVSNESPEWSVYCGTTMTYSASITQGTTYHVWGDYTKGAGSNAVCHLYYATSDTKPGSPGITITTGTGTLQADTLAIGNSNQSGVTVFDKVRVSASTIGSTPN